MDHLEQITLHTENPEAIRADIEATKQQIQADLHALRDHVSEMVTPEGLWDQIQANPWPWLVGVGGALLLGSTLWQPRPARQGVGVESAPKPGLQESPMVLAMLPGTSEEAQKFMETVVQRATADAQERAKVLIEQATTEAQQRAEALMQKATEEAQQRASTRHVLAGLLVVEGVRWLQGYLAKRAAAQETEVEPHPQPSTPTPLVTERMEPGARYYQGPLYEETPSISTAKRGQS